MLIKKSNTESPKLLNIIEDLKDGFCTISPTGDFIYLNLAASDMLGIEKNENSISFYDNIVKKSKHISIILSHLEKSDYIKDYELDLYSISGNTIPVLLTITTIKDPTGKTIGYSALIKDMTFIKKIQQQLLQSQKMESIGMLASGVAHEFNNILTGIIPNAELIKMTIDPNDSNYTRAEAIQNSAYRAAEIVKKLLNFARTDNGLKDQIIDFSKAAKETIDIIKKLFDKRIEIEVSFGENLDFVKMDATSLQQIIMNLSINSKDAIAGDGKIKFKAENYFLNGENLSESKDLNPGRYVCLQIQDTGQGIDPNKLKYVFDPFYTTKGPGKGTGLGLSMVYGIVKNIDGKIEVKSKLNKGTTFTLYIPAAPRSQVKDGTEFVIESIGNGQSILVIDDEEMIREMAKDMLNILGFKVLLAPSALEGLKIYENHMADIRVVILDLLMPEMNGTDCFKHLKSINPDIKVIIASGMGEVEKKKELEQMGIVAYLNKPYKLEQMTDQIKNALDIS